MDKKKHKINKLYLNLLWFLLGLVFLGLATQYVYLQSPKYAISMNSVNSELKQIESKIDAKLDEFAEYLLDESFESLKYSAFEKVPYTLFVYENDDLIFWSDNKIVPENIESKFWSLKKMSSFYTLVKTRRVGNFNIVSLLPIKHNFPYENEELVNDFVINTHLDKSIQLTTNNPTSPYAVFSDSHYLFTLEPPAHPIYNHIWGVINLIIFAISFLLFFYLLSHFPLLLGMRQITFKTFLLVLIGSAAAVFSLVWFGIPHLFFYNSVFTAFEFSTNQLLNTHTHLTIVVFYFLSVIYLFAFHVKINFAKYKKHSALVRIFIPLFFASSFFILIFKILLIIVFNSSTDVQLQSFSEISFTLIWNHLLFLGLGVSYFYLHLKVHQMILKHSRVLWMLLIDAAIVIFFLIIGYLRFQEYALIFILSYLFLHLGIYISLHWSSRLKLKWNLVIWLLFFTLFVVVNFHILNRDKKFQKYQVLVQNYYNNDPYEEDKIAIALLNDLDKSILGQKRLMELKNDIDSIVSANQYLNNQILKGFWNKFNAKAFVVELDSDLDLEYQSNISKWGKKHQQSHFYIINNPNSDISFIAKYKIKSTDSQQNHLYLEFYKERIFKSYSYPNLLLDEEVNLLADLNLSSARYVYRKLSSSSGNYRYNPGINWMEKRKENYFMQYANGYNHYIYIPDTYNVFVVSELQLNKYLILFLHYVYTVLIFIIFAYIVRLVYRLIHSKLKIYYTFSYKFIFTFTLMMMLSFAAILYVSVGYMKSRYVDEQQEKMMQTKNYIQNLLQEKYAWFETLDYSIQNELISDLQELSYIYQTDIHVYDNNGVLIASSQMPIFTRELVSQYISPVPFYADLKDLNQIERIGNLEYQVAYTDFYNMDFLPIGYIAIPQFFSDELIRSDLETFFTVIFNIYLLILILFFFLSAFIGRQLTAPLQVLQNSLRQIRIGQENKKIEYKPKDEIRQLVDQYNRTVDELLKSVELLAQSERETAWKSMAKQVAHEIKNPLTPMKLTIQQLQRRKEIGDGGFDEYFDQSALVLIEQIENLSRIASSFSSFAKLPDAKLVKVDLVGVVKSVVKFFENVNEQIQFTFQCEEREIFVFADQDQLIQVFNNLVKNAIQAIPSDRLGQIRVAVTRVNNDINVSVADNGKGVAEEDKVHIFSPNFTTKSTGMGIGLAISRNIVRYMGGDITFETKYNKGTTFVVSLPNLVE